MIEYHRRVAHLRIVAHQCIVKHHRFVVHPCTVAVAQIVFFRDPAAQIARVYIPKIPHRTNPVQRPSEHLLRFLGQIILLHRDHPSRRSLAPPDGGAVAVGD